MIALGIVTAPLATLCWLLIGWQAKSWLAFREDADTWMMVPIVYLLITAGSGSIVIFGAERMWRDPRVEGPRLAGAARVCAGTILFVVLLGWFLPFVVLNSVCLHCAIG